MRSRMKTSTYSFGSGLPSVRIHRRHQMDPSRVDEFDDVLIILKIFGAEMVGEFEQEFPAQHLVPVHVGYVLELRIN